ncbi:MAG: hypothetical protein H6Q74_2163 [Firmicutes bacterium]|nr:hypothetical protein [Bacillota bacterium]
MNYHKSVMFGLTLIFIIIQVLVMLGLGKKEYPGFVQGTLVTTCIIVLYTFCENKYGIYMNNYIRAAVLVYLIGDSLGGHYLEYYITSTVFDKVLHVFGTYSLSLFFYILMRQLLTSPVSRIIIFIWVFCLGMSTGAIYEIIEFIGDTLTKPTLPEQPSLWDTDFDLISDFIGAIIAAIHASILMKRRNII